MRQITARTSSTGSLRLNVRRASLLEDSFNALRYKSADEMPAVGGGEVPPSSSMVQRPQAPPTSRKGFCDIVGYASAKQQLFENVVLPLTLPEGVRYYFLLLSSLSHPLMSCPTSMIPERCQITNIRRHQERIGQCPSPWSPR